MFIAIRKESPIAVTLLERHPEPRIIHGDENDPGDFYLFAGDPPPDVRVVTLSDASHIGLIDALQSLYTDQVLSLTMGQVRQFVAPMLSSDDIP